MTTQPPLVDFANNEVTQLCAEALAHGPHAHLLQALLVNERIPGVIRLTYALLITTSQDSTNGDIVTPVFKPSVTAVAGQVRTTLMTELHGPDSEEHLASLGLQFEILPAILKHYFPDEVSRFDGHYTAFAVERAHTVRALLSGELVPQVLAMMAH
jgi:hypothetical protein